MISVIVPVYNAEKYLRECIDSILAQTYTDFELLLIDDGSTDGAGEICDEYALKVEGLGMRDDGDTFHKPLTINHKLSIRVFHKENGGVSSARNLGLDNAKGDWVCFVDSDDTIPIDALETFAKAAREDADLVMTKYQKWNEDGELLIDYRRCPDRLFSTKEFIKEMYNTRQQEYQGVICDKLFRKAIITAHHLHFNEKICFNEDRLFVVQFACASGKNVVYKDHLTYNYVERSTGAMASLKTSYNRLFVTDFDALILMKKEIDRLPICKELRAYTVQGIYNSYNWNHRMMIQFGDYCPKNHWHMVFGLVKSGIITMIFKDALRPLILLFIPRLLIRSKK